MVRKSAFFNLQTFAYFIGVALAFLGSSQAFGAAFYTKIQTGGYVGLATFGLGIESFEIWRNEALYGYVPKSIGGHPIHTFAYKTDVSPWDWHFHPEMSWRPFSLGAGLIYTPNDKLFAMLPKKYPRKYYPSTAVFWQIHAGTEWVFGQTSWLHQSGRQSLFLELNAHEIGLLSTYDNLGYHGPSHLLTYTLGYKLAL
jgi:hypothetical protein